MTGRGGRVGGGLREHDRTQEPGDEGEIPATLEGLRAIGDVPLFVAPEAPAAGPEAGRRRPRTAGDGQATAKGRCFSPGRRCPSSLEARIGSSLDRTFMLTAGTK